MRHAVIIGGGKIGTSIAAHLARSFEVRLVGHDEIELGSPESVARLFRQILRIDLLVNCAGSYGAVGRVRDVKPEAWRAGLDVNLVGVYACCHAALPRMAPGGHIVNLGGGGKGPLEHISSYAAAKSALWRLTETLAAEEPELHVNAIAPGAMDSRMQNAVLDSPMPWADYLRAMRAGRDPGVPIDNTLRALDHLLEINPSGVMLFAREFAAPALRRVAGL